jgi:hypothetical protein
MDKPIKYVGLDAHKATIAVAEADGSSSEVRFVGESAYTPEAINKLVKQLRVGEASLSVCYEAGPCGYGILRLNAPNIANPNFAQPLLQLRNATCELHSLEVGLCYYQII